MTTLEKIEIWGNSHRVGALDYVRIVVGILITYKGFSFLMNMHVLYGLTSNMDIMFASAAIAHYVLFFHAFGGPLIILGIYTRLICVLQIPILLGAIFLVNSPKGFLSMGSHMELEISIVTLIAIILFVIFGAGKLSIDEIRRNQESESE